MASGSEIFVSKCKAVVSVPEMTLTEITPGTFFCKVRFTLAAQLAQVMPTIRTVSSAFSLIISCPGGITTQPGIRPP
jgi:hypothetical protein